MGVRRSLQQARYWYERAAAQGDELGIANLRIMDHNAGIRRTGTSGASVHECMDNPYARGCGMNRNTR